MTLTWGIDSSHHPSQKDVEPHKIASTQTISIEQEPKTSSSLASGNNNNSKVLTTKNVKKKAEKRHADEMKSDITEGVFQRNLDWGNQRYGPFPLPCKPARIWLWLTLPVLMILPWSWEWPVSVGK